MKRGDWMCMSRPPKQQKTLAISAEMKRSILIGPGQSSLRNNEKELLVLCKECGRVADEMITQLKNFEITPKQNLLKSVGHVLKSMWSSKELAEAEKKLARYRDMMNSRLLGSLWERVDQVVREQYAQKTSIDDDIRQIFASALLDINASMNSDLQKHTMVIEALVNREVKNFKDIDQIHKGLLESPRERSSNYVNVKEEDKKENVDNDEKFFFRIQQREAILHKAMTQDILDSLRKTFEWILEPMKQVGDGLGEPQWSDFVHWLREENGIYWINGKAGSGKSTLMKYIYENPRTRDHLQVWSKQTTLHVPPFFIWWRGTAVQKSQDGLLRSLFFDILQQIPELIAAVFPSLWKSLYLAKNGFSKLQSLNSLTTSSLSAAFQSLIAQNEIPIKLCLFIDGLDEYEGLEVEIAKVFKGVVLSQNVKVCVSSRPHVPFEDAFTEYPMLRLQDLTETDIHRYIQDRLVNDEMMRVLISKEPGECRDLVNEIVDSAQGVFLWVMLVVSSLINGLSNHDHIYDLQARLKMLPKDLDNLYEEIFLKVDGFYAEEASRLYQLIAEAIKQPGDWEPANLLSLRTLSLASRKDLDIASEIKIPSTDKTVLLEQAKRMDVLLKTRCGGLIEVQHGKHKTAELTPSMGVSYLHRTVRDFLEARKTRAVLLQRTGGYQNSAFKPAVAIFKSLAIQIGQLSESEREGDIGRTMKNQGLTYARRIDLDKRLSDDELLYLCDTFAQAAHWPSMIHAAITTSLCRYLQLRLEDDDHLEHDALDKPALDALVPFEGNTFLTPRTVKLLIKFGARPKLRFNGSTPWKNFLSHVLVYKQKEETPGYLLVTWSEIIITLLENGASLVAKFVGPDRHEFRMKGTEIISIFVGNLWSVTDMIEAVFEGNTNIHHRLRKSVQNAKDKKPPKNRNEDRSQNRKAALILNNCAKSPEPTPATIKASETQKTDSGSCCSLQRTTLILTEAVTLSFRTITV
ncbi:hypothetical protein HYALB_00000515 [Hymenoscyphus albidus]|uniref:NACHT domain-containing protein n=1 Tax=Hymenoscyphus albidus TaxID=595503 RepID=A0A9N9LYG5_9HELO|nr:hypothetical protein HYALB_00000515 [Hymenoscyphus albidus]